MTPALQFGALADATRCALVELLGERPRAVHELALAFPISRPAISRHLRLLKEAGLVAEERRGREHVYSVRRKQFQELSLWLDQHWNTKLNTLKALAEARKTKPQLETDS